MSNVLVQQVWDQPVTVTAYDRQDRPVPFSFRYLDVIGNGTFGIVCRAKDLATDEIVAVKTVYQDEGHQVLSISQFLLSVCVARIENWQSSSPWSMRTLWDCGDIFIPAMSIGRNF